MVQKSFDLKRVWPNEFLVIGAKNFRCKKVLGPKSIWFKFVLDPMNLRAKKFFGPKMFRVQKV